MLIARVQVAATDEDRQTLVYFLAVEAGRVADMFEGRELYVVSVDTSDGERVGS